MAKNRKKTWSQGALFSSKNKKSVWDGYDSYQGGRYDDDYGDDEHTRSYFGFSTEAAEKQETAWEYYKRTGFWRGYYQPSTVDYGYLEKMANLLGSRFSIAVEAGADWSSDVKAKKLTYDPISLMKYSKARILALLLHEIGHLKYTQQPEAKDSKYLAKYPKPAFEVFNVFEDFRIDRIMARAYAGAEDVYDANKPIIREMAQAYEQSAIKVIEHGYSFINVYSEHLLQEAMNKELRASNGNVSSVKIKEINNQVQKKIEAAEKVLMKKILFLHYIKAIMLTGYGEKVYYAPGMEKIEEYVRLTAPAIAEVESVKTSLDALKILDAKVYPIIEDLLKWPYDQNDKELSDAFGGGQDGANAARYVKENIAKVIDGMNFQTGRIESGRPGQQVPQRMGRGAGNPTRIPSEWMRGEYEPIRQSVDTAIKELIRRLMYLRKEESTPTFVKEQKRGKLHAKGLYRHATGNRRLFQKKLEGRDTVRQFAFSFAVDVSGSMHGEPLVHSVRGLVMMAEVMEKMEIPYEIKTFGNCQQVVKKFTDKLDDTAKSRIGGIMQMGGGGTTMDDMFDMREPLLKRQEPNKIMVILSDGDLNRSAENMHQVFMNKWVERGVKFIGVGIQCGDEATRLCYGNGISTDTPLELPQHFHNLLKSVILKKK